MRRFVFLLLLASWNANAESKMLDISRTVGDYYQYDIIAMKTFTVTKVTAALTAWAKPMTLVLRCDGKELAEPSVKKYTNTQLNVTQTLTATAEINLKTCSSKSVEAYFEAPGLEITETPIEVKVRKGRLLDEDFVRMTNDQMETNAEDLISYSGTMSQQAASEPTMHCIIETYSKRPGFSGIVQELITNYFNTFGVPYTPGKFSCPPTDTLEDRIHTCIDNPRDRTPFCSTVKLYNMSKSWFVGSYLEAKARKEKLGESEQTLKDKLTELQNHLKDEVDESDGILGIETGFDNE